MFGGVLTDLLLAAAREDERLALTAAIVADIELTLASCEDA